MVMLNVLSLAQVLLLHHDKDALDERKHCHDMTPSLACDSTSVLNALKSFSTGTSSTGLQLRVQNVLDAVAESVATASQTCLDQFTKFMCVTLSRSLNSLITPCLIGVPLTALDKKNGGYKPIAVGKFYGVWQVVFVVQLQYHMFCES